MDNGDSEINLHINEENLVRIGPNKSLGVEIDLELKWREHITFAIGKFPEQWACFNMQKNFSY